MLASTIALYTSYCMLMLLLQIFQPMLQVQMQMNLVNCYIYISFNCSITCSFTIGSSFQHVDIPDNLSSISRDAPLIGTTYIISMCFK